MLLVWFVLAPIFTGVICYKLNRHISKYLIVFIQLLLAALVVYSFTQIVDNGFISEVLGANNSILGIELVADRFSIIMVGLAVFLFTGAFFYTFSDDFFDEKFAMLFMIFQGLICGIFLSDDIFNIFVLIEAATVIVAILIMFKKDRRTIYDAIVYLLSQTVGMAFYLFGVGYLYKIFGVLSIGAIRESIHLVEASQLVLPFVFILTAISLKCAFFPLFSWLPRYHAPYSSPFAVSAILSGLYVKSGIYLFIRFSSLFSPVIQMPDFFIVISIMTAICGFLLALVQNDIKLILAYSTVSQMGLIALGLNVSNEISWLGSMFHILNHAIFKSLLFLTSGIIVDVYGTRDIRELRGVIKRMPVVGITTLLGILAITGAPFFNGSISKYFIQYGVKGTFLEYIIMLINMGTTIVFIKYATILWGKSKEKKQEVGANKSFVVALLAALCLAMGIFSTRIISLLFGIDVSIDFFLYLEKIGIYFLTVALAFLFYQYVISRNDKIHVFAKTSLTFPQIISLMIVFFVVLLLATAITFNPSLFFASVLG